MWWPHTKKPITAMADQRIDHEAVAEHPPPREAGDDLADHAHRRQDHDVDGRMRVEPEQMLEQQRIAAERRIEHRPRRTSARATISSSVIASTGVASTRTRLVA